MVANINKLNGKIIENGYNKKMFAEIMAITEATLRKKINEETSGFTIEESLRVKDLLKLSKDEYLDIFFGKALELKSK